MDNITELLNHSGMAWKECLDALEKEAMAPSAPVVGYRTTRLLPRKDFALYGECPKLETRVLVECIKCSMVLLPPAFRNHCLNPNHGKNPIKLVSSSSTATSSKSSSSSKSSKPSNYVPPGASLLKKKYQQPKNKRKSGLPPPVPPPPLFAETSTPASLPLLLPSAAELTGVVVAAATAVATAVSASSSSTAAAPSASNSTDTKPTVDISVAPAAKPPSPSAPPVVTASPAASHSSSKHRKSKKSSKKSKEDSEKVHKTEKSSTESKLKLSTLLTPHKETAKPKDLPIVLLDYTIPVDGLIKGDAATTSIISSKTIPSYLKISPAPQQHSTQKDISQPLQVGIAPTSTNKTQGKVESPSSVVYMPMSPVAVVNNVPVQLLQLPVLRVTAATPSKQPILSPPLAVSRPIVVTIPLQSSHTQMYTAHPKPLSMSSRGVRKLGTAYLLQHQRIDHQRNEVQSVASTRQTIANACNALNNFNHHRPNILKNSTRNNFKFAVKRPSADRLLNDSTKHIRLNDVNGFILHADVSESAEAPMHNNSVHDKVTFLNMK